MGTSRMSRADYEIFSGKWKKLNSSNFEEFNAKNPDLAINNEDILIECIIGDDGYVCNAIVDGELAFTQNCKFNGIAENSNGDMKYTIESSLAESRMPGQSFSTHLEMLLVLFSKMKQFHSM